MAVETSVIDSVSDLLRARLEEIDSEVLSLEKAVGHLAGGVEARPLPSQQVDTQERPPKPQKSSKSQGKRGGARGRKGARAEEVVALVGKSPGLTATEIADALGMSRSNVYPILKRESDKLEDRGQGRYFPAGQTDAAGAGAGVAAPPAVEDEPYGEGDVDALDFPDEAAQIAAEEEQEYDPSGEAEDGPEDQGAENDAISLGRGEEDDFDLSSEKGEPEDSASSGDGENAPEAGDAAGKKKSAQAPASGELGGGEAASPLSEGAEPDASQPAAASSTSDASSSSSSSSSAGEGEEARAADGPPETGGDTNGEVYDEGPGEDPDAFLLFEDGPHDDMSDVGVADLDDLEGPGEDELAEGVAQEA